MADGCSSWGLERVLLAWEMQAEERNATLEMQAAARPTSAVAGGGEAGSSAAPESRCCPSSYRSSITICLLCYEMWWFAIIFRSGSEVGLAFCCTVQRGTLYLHWPRVYLISMHMLWLSPIECKLYTGLMLTAGGGCGDREASLAGEVRLLREELAGAQEAAASAAGNAKQYQALATSSDEALRSMQACYSQQTQLLFLSRLGPRFAQAAGL